MPITLTDVFDLQSEEQDSRIVSLTRRGRVDGLTSTSPTNYAAEVYASSAIPSAGSAIVVNGDTLYLRKRSINVNDSHALGECSIDLMYELFDGSKNETEETPVLEIDTALRQVERQVDRDGNPFVVSYIWPADSKARYPDGTPKANTTERVAGVLRVLEPATTLSGEIIYATNAPGSFGQGFASRLNQFAWQGFDPRHWMCSRVRSTPINLKANPPLWKFAFMFELDETGWDTQTAIAFIDPDTGEAPPDIAEGNGLLTVPWYQTKDFNEDF